MAQVAHVLAEVLLSFAVAQAAWGACTPPQSMAVRLRASPDAALYAELGEWYADRKQFSCAADAFRRASALQPASARDLYLLGLSLYSEGKSAEAVAPLEDSLRREPHAPQSHATLAAALEGTGDRRDAALQWRLVLADDPSSALALDGLSRDLIADGNYAAVIALLEPLRASAVFTDAMAVTLSVAYTRSGLPENAAELLRRQLLAHPASLAVCEALSGVLILQSRFQDALAVLAPVARQNPAYRPLQVLYLQALVLAHDPTAEAVARSLLVKWPRDWELLYFTGVLYQQNDANGIAEGYFRRSLAEKPDSADTHYRLGQILTATGRDAAGKQELERAIALGLDSPDVHVALSTALRGLGDDAGAQQQAQIYQQRLHAQAARAQAADKAQQGDQAESAGNLQQTVEDYREALALDPQEPVLAYKLAMALDKSGDRPGERAALQQALRLDPKMAIAQNQLGYLDASEGNTDAAVSEFQLAVQADPGFTKAWLNLAASLCLQSKWPEARQALHHLLDLDPENAGAKALLQKVDEMEAQR
ncbi:MAG TPA: tetratricopeptide repeat protein [Acidobacteriaceae bacterium]|nr:tetratricopeptide repeat protein [Acidobacteriaceae bacterium]